MSGSGVAPKRAVGEYRQQAFKIDFDSFPAVACQIANRTPTARLKFNSWAKRNLPLGRDRAPSTWALFSALHCSSASVKAVSPDVTASKRSGVKPRIHCTNAFGPTTSTTRGPARGSCSAGSGPAGGGRGGSAGGPVATTAGWGSRGGGSSAGGPVATTAGASITTTGGPRREEQAMPAPAGATAPTPTPGPARPDAPELEDELPEATGPARPDAPELEGELPEACSCSSPSASGSYPKQSITGVYSQDGLGAEGSSTCVRNVHYKASKDGLGVEGSSRGSKAQARGRRLNKHVRTHKAGMGVERVRFCTWGKNQRRLQSAQLPICQRQKA